jgi:competence protein ComGC
VRGEEQQQNENQAFYIVITIIIIIIIVSVMTLLYIWNIQTHTVLNYFTRLWGLLSL